ncbi:MAG: GAF domain-containing protein [Bacteroidetes bacterium]|nr:MAG: GAF domain-containing protein [Bacteroidota bacterium]
MWQQIVSFHKRLENLSIKIKLIVALIGILSISLFGLSIFNYHQSKNELEKTLLEEQNILVEEIYAMLQKELSMPFFISNSIANDLFIKEWISQGELKPELMQQHINQLKKQYPIFVLALTTNKNNDYYNGSEIRQLLADNPKDQWYFAFKRKQAEQEMNLDNSKEGILSLFLNKKILNEKAEQIGIVTVGIKLEKIVDLILAKQIGKDGKVYVVDESGIIKIHKNKRLVSRKDDLLNANKIQEQDGISTIATKILTSKRGNFEYISRENSKILVQTEFFEEFGWHLIVEVSEMEMFIPIYQLFLTNIGVQFLLILFIIFFCIFAIDTLITKPLNKLNHNLLTFFDFLNRKTDRVKLLNISAKDEIGIMSDIINENIVKIQDGIVKDTLLIKETTQIIEHIQEGFLTKRLLNEGNNRELVNLRQEINEMLEVLEGKIGRNIYNIIEIMEEYGQIKFDRKISHPKGEIEINTNKMGENIALQHQRILVQNEELQQQQEEIESQRDYISEKNKEIVLQKENVERLYDNIVTLSEVGRRITSILDITKLTSEIYIQVNQLMSAPIFAIALHNEEQNELDFWGIKNDVDQVVFSSDSLENDNFMSVWCFKNQREIVINDFESEHQQYVQNPVQIEYETRHSMVYLPLQIQDKFVGIITVQSFERDSYDEQSVSLLRNLAVYISVAIANAHNFGELDKAKQMIEERNKQTMDSIRYAQTIQQAILPSVERLERVFGKDNYFVFFQPKDLVSGDFYFLTKNRHTDSPYSFLATVDCTGHGVPGAFMSLIGSTLLKQIISEKRIENPYQILETLHEEVIRILRQKKTNNSDGMDICLCRIEQIGYEHEIVFCGAKRSLYFTENGILKELRGDHKSIGGVKISTKYVFANQIIRLPKGEMLYLASDGFIDQNNVSREKYGSVKFRALLQRISSLPLKEQVKILKDTIDKHQEKTTQRDDITVLGIRLT